jgi:hypothetical protein
MKDESTIQQEIQIEAVKYNCILMRNNCGCLLDADGRPVRYGLGNVSKQHQERIASSDLIGFTKVIITPDMVGKVLAIFTAIEVKKEDWNESKKLDKRETAQSNFINWIKNNGGVGGFCNCVNKLKDIFKI